MTRKHLTKKERTIIMKMLNSRCTIRNIAKRLGRSPSTISREISNNAEAISGRGMECANKNDCTRHNLCNKQGCKQPCNTCLRCRIFCDDFVEKKCRYYLDNHCLCNGCKKQKTCKLSKRIYIDSKAQDAYKKTIKNAHTGTRLRTDELSNISDLIMPLVNQGQSLCHIKQTHNEDIPVSVSTLYRLINDNKLDVRNIDLAEKVKRKMRKNDNSNRKKGSEEQLKEESKEGHLYSDFQAYISENDVMVVQMDCVEGLKTDNVTLLTLHFVAFHFQIAFIMKECSTVCVVKTLNRLETLLGQELYHTLFEVILTDNEEEFKDISGIETSIFGGQRTKLFYCDVFRSDEKGSCENNHRFIRKVVPKGFSFKYYNQSDITKMMNHINSYTRRSICGKSPYQLAKAALPEEFFTMLNLKEIPPDEIILNPSLLKRDK